MVFSSFTFIFIFLPAALLLYYLAPGRLKNSILLLVSLTFYSWGEPVYIFLMLLSILLNYFSGLYLEGLLEKRRREAKRNLAVSVGMNLLLLGFFKYTGFLLYNVNGIFHTALTIRSLALPLGISFYSFQAISYLIDVYRGEAEAQRNLLDFALYITMFPQLIAGPIVRYTDIEKQLRHRNISLIRFGEGTRYFITGLGKKVILANRMGQIFETIHQDYLNGQTLSVSVLWLGAIAYTMQIYFDFSGYSDMAIGLGKMFGFDFRENFHYPYLSESITDFWRRWHISLGAWFREYVYIPLGGNRKGIRRQILNLFIVWFLTGLWHGAEWNFVVWGLYYGVLLILEKFFLQKYLNKVPALIRHVYVMVLVIIGWVFFFSEHLRQALGYIGRMFGMHHAKIFETRTLFVLNNYRGLWVLAVISCTGIVSGFLKKRGYRHSLKWFTDLGYIVLFLVSISYLIANSYNPFIYFRF